MMMETQYRVGRPANDPSTDPTTSRATRYTLPVALMAGLALLGLAWFLVL